MLNTGNSQIRCNNFISLTTRWSSFTGVWVYLKFLQRKTCITVTFLHKPMYRLSCKWKVNSYLHMKLCVYICSRRVPPSHCICLSLIQLSVFPVTFPTDSLVNEGHNQMILNYQILKPFIYRDLWSRITLDHFTFAFTLKLKQQPLWDPVL